MDNTVSVEVWGDYALFTRPEFNAERYSYDVITPGAARHLLQSIYWHPQIDFAVRRITVFNPVQHTPVTKNELTSITSFSQLATAVSMAEEGLPGPVIGIGATEQRQQRLSNYLRDVHYKIEAEILPKGKDAVETDEDWRLIRKSQDIFNRRVEKGQCFRTPYLGTRECKAHFAAERPLERRPSPIRDSRELGFMLFDVDYDTGFRPLYFFAKLKDGVVNVPDRKEVISV